jgi:hypothetical protein
MATSSDCPESHCEIIDCPTQHGPRYDPDTETIIQHFGGVPYARQIYTPNPWKQLGDTGPKFSPFLLYPDAKLVTIGPMDWYKITDSCELCVSGDDTVRISLEQGDFVRFISNEEMKPGYKSNNHDPRDGNHTSKCVIFNSTLSVYGIASMSYFHDSIKVLKGPQ